MNTITINRQQDTIIPLTVPVEINAELLTVLQTWCNSLALVPPCEEFRICLKKLQNGQVPTVAELQPVLRHFIGFSMGFNSIAAARQWIDFTTMQNISEEEEG